MEGLAMTVGTQDPYPWSLWKIYESNLTPSSSDLLKDSTVIEMSFRT